MHTRENKPEDQPHAPADRLLDASLELLARDYDISAQVLRALAADEMPHSKPSQGHAMTGHALTHDLLHATGRRADPGARADRRTRTTLAAGFAVALLLFGLIWYGNSTIPTIPEDGNRGSAFAPNENDSAESSVPSVVEDPAISEVIATLRVSFPQRKKHVFKGSHITDEALEKAIADGHLKDVDGIFFYNCAITAKGLRQLAKLPQITGISLSHCAHVDDAGLEALATMTQLTHLDLTGFVGQTANFGEPDPNYVSPYAKYTDAGIAHLEALPKLRAISFFGTAGSASAYTDFVRRTKSSALAHLDLGHTQADEATMQALSRLDELWELDAASTLMQESEVIEALKARPQLERLSIGGNGFNKAKYSDTLAVWISRMERLRGLSMEFVSGISPTGWQTIAKTPNLKSFKVWSADGIGTSVMQAIAAMPHLRRLELWSQSAVNDAGIRALKDAKMLEFLSVQATTVSEKALVELRKSLPNLQIRMSNGKMLPFQSLRLLIMRSNSSFEDAATVVLMKARTIVSIIPGKTYQITDGLDLPELPANAAKGKTLYDSLELTPGDYTMHVHCEAAESISKAFTIRRGQRTDEVIRLPALEAKPWPPQAREKNTPARIRVYLPAYADISSEEAIAAVALDDNKSSIVRSKLTVKKADESAPIGAHWVLEGWRDPSGDSIRVKYYVQGRQPQSVAITKDTSGNFVHQVP